MFLWLQAKNEADTKNRGIYFCIEPTPDQLAPISPLALAKVKPFDPSKEMEGTVDYFADFVPQVVASAIEEFTGKVGPRCLSEVHVMMMEKEMSEGGCYRKACVC